MLTRLVLSLRPSKVLVLKLLSRNIGVTAACYQKAQGNLDPIQRLFVDKIHEYAQKSKASGGKLVDASAETEKLLHDELEKLARQYGAKDTNFIKFPSFSFTDPDLDPVGVQVDIKQQSAVEIEVAAVKSEDDEDRPYFQT